MTAIDNRRTSAAAGRPPRRVLIAVIAATVTAAVLAAITPWPRGFQGTPTGDAALMTALEDALGSQHWQHVAVARIDGNGGRYGDGKVTFAGTGADEHTEFEIGSITKTFTAALFAEAIDRGEVKADTRLGEVWPDLEGKVAEVTLESIAMQRSGLPSQEPAPSFGDGVMSVLSNYLHTDPYRGDAGDIVASLNDVEVGEPEPEYSNYGFAVLGQALAEAAGQDYSDLVRYRLTEPLGMEETFVPESADGLSHGFTASGLPAAPWTMTGSAPAGAIRSTTHDLSIWLRAVRERTAPGAEAAEPRADFEDDRIGWAWFTTTHDGSTITWHNGGTGGYGSYLGFDRETGDGAIVLNDSANDVDAAATLIGADAAAASADEGSAKGDRS
jgi:CubicO group peptidase (beta-lactamase class C family)